MAISKKYIHDKTVLLLMSVNAFLVVLTAAMVLTRLDYSKGGGYIVGYRPELGLDAYRTGSISDLLAFIVFALLVGAIHAWLSIRIYPAQRHAAIAVLGTGTLLLILTLIVSYSLLMLG